MSDLLEKEDLISTRNTNEVKDYCIYYYLIKSFSPISNLYKYYFVLF